MEPERVSQRPITTPDEGGFTFLELMAAISLLLLFASLIVVRFDLTGFRSGNELHRLRTFFRTQQMVAMNRSRVRTIRVTSAQAPSFQVPGAEDSSPLVLRHWEINEPSPPFQFQVGPTGVFGPAEIRLENGSEREKTLVPDRLLSLREVKPADGPEP